MENTLKIAGGFAFLAPVVLSMVGVIGFSIMLFVRASEARLA